MKLREYFVARFVNTERYENPREINGAPVWDE